MYVDCGARGYCNATYIQLAAMCIAYTECPQGDIPCFREECNQKWLYNVPCWDYQCTFDPPAPTPGPIPPPPGPPAPTPQPRPYPTPQNSTLQAFTSAVSLIGSCLTIIVIVAMAVNKCRERKKDRNRRYIDLHGSDETIVYDLESGTSTPIIRKKPHRVKLMKELIRKKDSNVTHSRETQSEPQQDTAIEHQENTTVAQVHN